MIKFLAWIIVISAGNSAATTLELSRGARAFALGGELTAFSPSMEAVYYNPAHCISAGKFGINVSTFPIGLDVMDNSILLSYSTNRFGGGIGVSYTDYGDFNGLDEHAREPYTFNASDLIVTAFGGYMISQSIKMGLSFKFFKEEIEAFRATSYSVSAGIAGKIDNKTDYGVVIRNLGTGIKFINESNPLPLTLVLGAVRKVGYNIFLIGHLKSSRDVPVSLTLGCEYSYNDIAFFRLGFRSDKAGLLSKFSTGLGFIYKGFAIDFGLSGYQNLGLKYVISFSYSK
ncbi:MAG: hypothetical protein QMD82_06925 [bacterium]|nr:hypothetical protein [bacterium]